MDNTELDSTQFTILGLTGSGKTCYLLGMYKKMAAGMKGFSLTTDSDTDVNLRRRYRRMEDQSLGINRFPAGTDQPDSYSFTLSHAMESIMSFDWIDYPGGALDEQTSGNLEAFNKLESHIQNSSSLFICVDGELINGDDCDEIAENIKDKCSGIINNFLKRYKDKNKFLPPTAIVVTKCDMCQELEDDEWEEILREAFSPILAEGNDKCNRFVCCIPVSLGSEISSNGYKGILKPRNLELPIYMGIYFSTMCKAICLRKKMEFYKKQLNSLRNETQKEENSFFIWRDNEKIAKNKEMEDIYRKLEKEITENFVSVLADNSRLSEVLNKKVEMIFFNGKRQETFENTADDFIEKTPEFLNKWQSKNEKS
ncbi:TRAFAC clade GTPase domain-containing protein [Succinimonas sp.]|uniref:TRAFAC clade GTPase domain-containing protein n=1 Tax=Succinimonas sp. TaxID=1936151 RepID=UPI003866E5DE